MNIRLLVVAGLLLAAQQAIAQKGSVFVNGIARIEENGKNSYINTKGEKAFDDAVAVFHPADTVGGTDEGHFVVHTNEKEQMMVVRSNGKMGMLDDQGKWLLQPVYDTIDLRWKSYLWLSKGDKMTYADTRGKLLLPLQFQDAGILDDDHFDVKTAGKWGVFSVSQNKLVIPASYEAFDYCGGCGMKGGYVFAQKNGKWGVVNFANETLVPFDYEHEHTFMRSDNWILCFKKDGKQVVLNLAAKKEFGPPEYTDMEITPNGFLVAKKNGYYGLINEDGTPVTDFVYDGIRSPYGESDAGPFLEIAKNKKTGILREDGKVIIPPAYNGDITCYANCFIVPVNGNYNLLDTTGKKLLAKDYSEITGMATTFDNATAEPFFKLKQRALYGFYNPATKKIVEPAFFDIDRMSAESPLSGLLEVVYQEKKGVYNVSGELLLPVAYKDFYALSATLMAIKAGEHTGVYDTRNKRLLLQPLFSNIDMLPDDSSLLMVTKSLADGNYNKGLYDSKGAVVLPTLYSSIQPLNAHQYLLTIDKNDKREFILFNTKSRQQKKLLYDEVVVPAIPDRMLVARGGKSGIINATGEVIIPVEYDAITILKNNIVRLIKKKGGDQLLYGYADNNGEILVPLVYDADDDRGYVREEDTVYLPLVKKDAAEGGYRQGLASQQGVILVPPMYDKVLYEKSGKGFLVQKDGKFIVLNNTGQPVSTHLFDDVALSEGVGYGATGVTYSFPLLCREGDNYQYLGEDGKLLSFKITTIIPFAPEQMYGIPVL